MMDKLRGEPSDHPSIYTQYHGWHLFILEMEVKKLRNREVESVKVQLSKAQEDVIREIEDKAYAPHTLFLKGTSLIPFFLEFYEY